MDEASLAEGIRRRDPNALDAAYAEYGRTVFAYLARTIGDHAAAEDVQQQVFVDVWQRGPTFDPGRGRLFTWIMTIARSRAIDQLRKRIPEPRDPAVAAQSAEPQADETERAIERWRVAHMLRRIPSDEAAMLRLRFYEGLSQSEISERTGVPLGTVKMRMVQALERLRTLVGEEAA
jgi:RNA polymerase sigma-70 factor (ECF subfamily)